MPIARTVSDQTIVAKYKATRSTVKTAETLGLGQATVTRVLDKHGIERTGLERYRSSMGSKWKPGEYPGNYAGSEVEVIEWYQSGLSMRDIAGKIGRSTHVVARIIKKAGISRVFRGKGDEHSNWVGGRIESGQGYRKQWIGEDDPMASMRDNHGYVKEHRLVMARKLGRPLLPIETVHHIDGDRSNNARKNLQLRHGKHGSGSVMVCLDCGSHNIGHKRS